MRDQRKAIIGWVFFGLIFVSVTAATIYDLSSRPTGQEPTLGEISFISVPLAFAFVGALIISHQPRNVIGLLMMLPGISLFVVVDAYLRPFIHGYSPIPESPSPVFLLILWFSNWNWLLLVFPLMFIMVLFPTGRPLSRRWGWLIVFGMGLAIMLIYFSTFSQTLAPGSGKADWAFRNPIGFLEREWIDVVFIPFIVFMPVWVVLCFVSLLVRFRRAGGIEREQIKWLFYAGAIFAVFYIPPFILRSYSQAENIWNLLFGIGMLAFPAAIAIAILRYRLFDIDVIIRRTLVYAALTATLALIYFGSVILLQNLVTVVGGQQTAVVTVISTLLIAALFTPLRRRIQNDIDRRFFRRKYDAEKVVAAFSAGLREEVHLEGLQAQIVAVVEETLHPEQVGLWLRTSLNKKTGTEL